MADLQTVQLRMRLVALRMKWLREQAVDHG